MKFFKLSLASLLLVSMAYAVPLSSSGRACIPAEALQVISVDYRSLKDSPTAMALKQQLMPDNIKQLEEALKGIGIDPDKDMDTLTFASFHQGKQGVRGVGIATGPFDMKTVRKKMKLQHFTPTKYPKGGTTDIYPMDGGMIMSFLDDSTLIFGEPTALHHALDVRDGKELSLDTNGNMSDMMTNVDAAAVWSILDQEGTQNMMRSALGDAAKIGDYETMKKKLLGSRYTMNFTTGVNFDATIVTDDGVTAGTLTSMVKAYLLYKKTTAAASEKVVMENTSAESDGSNVQIHFKSDDKQFQALMHTDLFNTLSR
jgi:hypothetical protein